MKPATSPCLFCGQRQGRVRGLCDPCLVKCTKAVQSGKTSWAELERRGVALPSEAKRRTQIATDDPLEAITPT